MPSAATSLQRIRDVIVVPKSAFILFTPLALHRIAANSNKEMNESLLLHVTSKMY